MKKLSWLSGLAGCLFIMFSGLVFADEQIEIYAPATPSSIPILLAAQNLPQVKVTIFSDHSQAHGLFLRGDIPILTTGLSVGVSFFKNNAPVQIINSYVAGMTYLVTTQKKAASFADLRGQKLYLPFEGSPIEEITKFFLEQEGVVWKQDITPVYAQFPSAVELLKKGDVQAVALPEPFVSLVETFPNVFVSFGYQEKWDALTNSKTGYPQVGTFVKRDWAEQHPEIISALNAEIAKAIALIRENPEQAVTVANASLKFPEKILRSSLNRTRFALSVSDQLKQDILRYYQTIGKPLDDTFQSFFYLPQK